MRLILVTIFSILFLFNSNFIYSENIKKRGTVTGLEIPRFVSLKKSRTFLRRGPGKSYKIDWILEKYSYPLKVLGEHNHWRQVIDFEGDEGWVYFRLLSGKRTVIISKEKVFLMKSYKKESKPIAVLKYGVIGNLLKESEKFCKVKFQNYIGWVKKDNIWGC